MFKTKSTKRALLLSALSLLLCVSMLVGSTFAWFTDSVTSGQNTIQSGNLDVELYYTYNAAVAADVNSTAWEKVTSTSDIFGHNLWEPGYTKVAYFKVVNEGSLELKYQLAADVYEEKAGKNQAGAEFLLSDYIKTALVNVGATRNEILAMEGTPLKNSYDMSKGSLAADATAVVGLAIWMPTTVGNVANHDGNTVPEITFGINLLATQMTAESDSFGSDYDKNAPFGTYIELEAGADLLAAMASAEADKPLTIKLLGNIELPTTGSAGGAADITPASSVVIDGNGNTITVTGSGVTPIGDKEAPVTLKNAKVVDESKSYNESAWELSYCELGGVITCENVDFADAVMVEGTSANFVNCSFVGHNDKLSGQTQYAVWVSNGDATFTNCTVTGTRGIKICDQYAPEVGTVVIDGCTFNTLTEKPGVAIDDNDVQDMNIIIKNSTFINCQAGDQDLYIYETDNTVPTLENNEVYGSVNNVATTADLITAIRRAPVGAENLILLADGTYAGDIDISVAALGAAGGDVIIRATAGAKPVITGNITLGYRNQGTGATMYNANVTFEGITFDQAEAGKHSITVMDVKSLTLKDCTIIGDGEYGIDSARGNATGTSKIVGCTFKNAGMQILGNFGTGLVIDGCTFNESRINIQAGNSVTVQNCEFKNTLTAANVDDSFYAIRTNSTPVTVKKCEFSVDSELTGVATSQAKWYLLANRGTTNWTVEDVAVTLTDAAVAQTALNITACTSTGKINTTNLTVNGVAK